jgi:hypothetical protein
MALKLRMQGQALVETAIIAPLLVFMLIGVFEVGFALHGYLVLANANREAARFAVRQDYLNFDREDIGYEKVWTHTLDSIAEQIPFEENGVMIISYIHIATSCTQTLAISSPLNVPTYTWTYPFTSTKVTLIDYGQIISDTVPRERARACNLEANSLIPMPNNMLIVEMFWAQRQLFGFPLISNPFTDPVPMYAHSIFRKAPDSREQK